MMLKNLILFAFLSASSAFTIPDGTEDGVYEHYVDANGLDVHIKIADPTNYSDPSSSAYTKEPNFIRSMRIRSRGVNCGASKNMHRGDTDAANADLDRQCDTYGATKPRHNFYAIRGNVVAFYCNFSQLRSLQCTSGERGWTSARITEKCGLYNSGWYDDDQGASYGYDTGRCFCGECV